MVAVNNDYIARKRCLRPFNTHFINAISCDCLQSQGWPPLTEGREVLTETVLHLSIKIAIRLIPIQHFDSRLTKNTVRYHENVLIVQCCVGKRLLFSQKWQGTQYLRWSRDYPSVMDLTEHDRVHMSSQTVNTLGQTYLAPSLTPQLNFSPPPLPPSKPKSQNWSLFFRFQTNLIYEFHSCPMLAVFSTHVTILHLMTLILFGQGV